MTDRNYIEEFMKDVGLQEDEIFYIEGYENRFILDDEQNLSMEDEFGCFREKVFVSAPVYTLVQILTGRRKIKKIEA